MIILRELSYLKECPIAVLGAGAVGMTLAADCKLGQPDREVRLYSRSKRSIAYMDRTGIQMDGIQRNLYGFERSGRARLDMYTTDMVEAVKGAKFILISVPALAHEDYLRALVPLLEDGMVIHTFPDNYASFLLRRFMREAGCTKDVIIGGWSSAPYGTRVEKIQGFWTNHVSIKYRAISLRGACLPMSDMDDFIESGKYLPCMDSVYTGNGPERGDTMIDIGFSNINPVIHVPASLLGVSSMENWSLVYGNEPESYSMYSHGLCPSICRVQYQFYQEQVAIAKKIGIDYPKWDYEMFFSRRSILTQEYMGLDENGKDNVVFPLNKPCDEGNTGPDDINHRYITEDIPVGCKIYHDLGVKFGVPTPIIDAIITIGGAFHEKSFYDESKYDLDYLGIGHMSKDQLMEYLYTGKYTDNLSPSKKMNRENKKKLLILGATAWEIDVVKRAQQLGYYVIVTDNHPNPEINSPAKFVADLAWDISWLDFDSLADACRQAGVGGVISGFSEIRVEAQIKLCERLGLPCDTTLNQLEITRDKMKFKNLCRECGIPVIEEFNEHDAINHLPVIIKPTDRAGSIGIKVVKCREDFHKALEHSRAASLTNSVIIEKYIGDRTKVDAYYLVENGIPHLMEVSSTFIYPQIEGQEICQRGWFFPSRHKENWLRNIHPHMPDMIKALKLKNGYLTISAFAAEDGTFRCFESGLRLSGELSYKFIEAAYGYSYLNFIIARAMSDQEPMICDFNRQTDLKMFIFNFHTYNGIVRDKRMPKDNYYDLLAAATEIHSDSRYPYVGMYFSTGTNSSELIDKIINADKESILTDVEGRDMITCRTDSNAFVDSITHHIEEE